MNAPGLFEKLGDIITAADIFCIAGILFFGRWLLKTSFGRKALTDSSLRRNNMPLYLPFIPLFMWFLLLILTSSITEILLPHPAHWQKVLFVNISLCVSSIITMALIIVQVRFSFARRLKGFGLNVKKIHKDFLSALVNLLTIWPIVMFALVATIYIGELIWGQDFQMQQHEELELAQTGHSLKPGVMRHSDRRQTVFFGIKGPRLMLSSDKRSLLCGRRFASVSPYLGDLHSSQQPQQSNQSNG